ncbi:PucR family transcriptional regulator ligand-binding domain-containing protein [Herbiconiux sp. CPCC 203407]|uniref:PucR family transcriptional regulator ligand-binding domain-containing protein n=1 Tax=Herbiconiux oxytropis TaxID=2970915 RepID=A0AA42BUM2_9MICO|nr:PucR family transcriptional regulator ligand-binding domain-containing protein [Herbiconiux oxytropis]MCS5721926.1 PucR family transcriptional regulator ligand-binding domain-containing protein [Herbiconiux oxytropis]MCS5725509.1 PucR family transcriptional regulator ligand-binding domain-containing protein [Herbiconiux oxytropis]
MPITLDLVLAEQDFAIDLLTPQDLHDYAVDWAHNSDLPDPTPFVGAGQLLLTTGRQFANYDADDYRGYVQRLAGVGVVAIGFGTEVVREGTPAELVAACAEAGIPLVEIPYDTPFIAISRFIAEHEAQSARARVEWALAAQNDIAQAAVGGGGLGAAVGVAAAALGAEVWVFDADAQVIEHAGGSGGSGAAAGLREQVERLLARTSTTPAASDPQTESMVSMMGEVRGEAGSGGLDGPPERSGAGTGPRSRSDFSAGGRPGTAQTLGAPGRTHGVIAWARADPFDAGDEAVATVLTALADVSLEHAEDLRISHRTIMEQLFQLLRDGGVETVRRAAGAIRIVLPGEPFQVFAIPLPSVTPALHDSLERRAARPRTGYFTVTTGEHLVLLVDQGRVRGERAFLEAHSATAGVSDPAGWDELNVALTQAVRAAEGAPAGRVADFSQLVNQSFFGLLATGSVADVARARLAPLLRSAEGRESLRFAEVWLRHNGRWDPAARELGLHRHSLRLRIDSLADRLGVPLDTFQGRAELWALLAALELARPSRPA